MKKALRKDVVASVEKAYKKVAKKYEGKVKSEDLDHPYIEKFLTLLMPEEKILDLGAGTGTISEEMIERHRLSVEAIDISREMLKLAKRNNPKLKILRMDLRKLKFPPSSFDGVFANYSLIHIPESDVLEALKGVAHILKKHGYLYLALQEPVKKIDKDGYYPLVYAKHIKMFINLFTEKEMGNYLKKAGFKVLWCTRRKADKKFEFPFNKLFIVAQSVRN